MKKEEVMEMVAIDLGFVADKYYTAKEKMFTSCGGPAFVRKERG